MTAPGKAEPVLPGREEHAVPDTRPAQPDPDPSTVDPEPVTGSARVVPLLHTGGLHVTEEDLAVWRATYGLADLDDWCRAHGWTARTVVAGSMHIEAGTAFALVIELDPDGRPVYDRHGGRDPFPRVLSRSAPLARPIPAGIGARP